MNNMKITSIDALLQHSISFGTGFIPTDQDQWWFAIGNKKYWKELDYNRIMISYTAIGGYVEQNESFTDATLREVIEESGAESIIEDANETLYVKAKLYEKEIFDFNVKSVEIVLIENNPKPWIVYSLERQTGTLGVVVYQGKFLNEPFPSAEVPALICLPPDLLLQSPSTLELLLKAGAKIKEKNGTIPRKAVLYPFGSAKIVKEILQNI